MSPIHDESSRPMWLVAQLIDQTERLQAEREALEHRERLAHMDRLGTLGEMAAAIAHEVNQPLGAISNYAQAGLVMLAKPEVEPQKLAEILEKVSAQALRAGEVIRRLRTLAGRGQGGRDVLDLNQTVREVVKLAELDAHLREVTIETDLREPMPEIVADEVQVQQVVLNLLRNGIEAMEAVPEPRPSLVVNTCVSAADVEINVADRGEGIAPEVADKIMSPFFSSKQSGMGLGLAICRSIIDSHGGRLWFTPNGNAGTVFHVTLPIEGRDLTEGQP